MSGQSTCSLSEALTTLAFDDPTPASQVPAAMKNRRWHCCPTVAHSQIMKAAKTLIDAGYRGDVAISGRDTAFPLDLKRRPATLRPLTKIECDIYRFFAPGQDALWEGENRGNRMADAFDAYASNRGVCDVRVDLADLSGLVEALAASATASEVNLAPFTVTDIDAWIASTPFTGMKKARDAFMNDARAQGLSAAFEKRWSTIKQNPVGRPRAR